MSEVYVENSITEKMRQVRQPSSPVKSADKISLEAYREAISPAVTKRSIKGLIDPSKLKPKK